MRPEDDSERLELLLAVNPYCLMPFRCYEIVQHSIVLSTSGTFTIRPYSPVLASVVWPCPHDIGIVTPEMRWCSVLSCHNIAQLSLETVHGNPPCKRALLAHKTRLVWLLVTVTGCIMIAGVVCWLNAIYTYYTRLGSTPFIIGYIVLVVAGTLPPEDWYCVIRSSLFDSDIKGLLAVPYCLFAQ